MKNHYTGDQLNPALKKNAGTSITSRFLLLIMGLSFVLRLAVALYLGDSLASDQQARVYDQNTYHLLAQSLLAGKGYSFDRNYYPGFTPANTPTAHWSFLYPLFLAGTYAIFGIHPLAARIIQILIISLLETWLIFRLGKALFHERVGLIGAGLAAVYVYLIFYDASLMTEPFFIVTVLGLLYLGISLSGMSKADNYETQQNASLKVSQDIARTRSKNQWAGHNDLVQWILFGFLTGIAALLRQTVLLWIPFQLLWMIWARSTIAQEDGPSISPPRRYQEWIGILRGPLIAIICASIIILPWTARNYLVYDSFLPLNSNAGYALYSANHPDHGIQFDQDYAAPLPEDLLQRKMNEALWNTALARRGIEFILQDPVRYILLTGSKVGVHFNFWFSKESSSISNWMRVLSFGLYLPLFVLGIILSTKDWKRCSLIYLFILLFNLMHILSWAGTRYRLPVDAALMPFAGLTVLFVLSAFAKINSKIHFST